MQFIFLSTLLHVMFPFFILLCFKCVEMVNDNGLMVIICWILSLAALAFQFMKPWSTNHIMLGTCRIMANEWYFTSLNMHINAEENYRPKLWLWLLNAMTINEADILTHWWQNVMLYLSTQGGVKLIIYWGLGNHRGITAGYWSGKFPCFLVTVMGLLQTTHLMSST